MFYLETGMKSHCYGCRACEHVCPLDCIDMLEDNEGFRYPSKNDARCADCGHCRSVCPNAQAPFLLANGNTHQPRGFMAIHRDECIRESSSSGGAFSAIVEAFCNHDGEFAIFGAEFDDHFKVVHSYAESVAATERFRKSKYVQSDTQDGYVKARRFLREGRRVLFTGTPCQIAGLRLYLGREYENLLTVDLVCHGVPSSKVFSKYLTYLRHRFGGPVLSFTFRYKTCNRWGKWNSRNVKVDFGSRHVIMDSQTDLYLQAFHAGLFNRPSCYECRFATPRRISDITLADFWGLERVDKEEQVHKGVSALLINTPKGEFLLDDLSRYMRLVEVDSAIIVEGNSQLQHPVRLHPFRQRFFQQLNSTDDFRKAVSACIPTIHKLKWRALALLGPRGRSMAKRILQRIRKQKHTVLSSVQNSARRGRPLR